MNNSEKLYLQWNDFKQNISSSFGELREDKDLTDVTLACEDGKQVAMGDNPFFTWMNIFFEWIFYESLFCQ